MVTEPVGAGLGKSEAADAWARWGWDGKTVAWFLVALFAQAASVCKGQTAIPDRLPEFKYPPIARAARVQGDVIVSFRQTPEGGTADVSPISGPPLLRDVAVEYVKAW